MFFLPLLMPFQPALPPPAGAISSAPVTSGSAAQRLTLGGLPTDAGLERGQEKPSEDERKKVFLLPLLMPFQPALPPPADAISSAPVTNGSADQRLTLGLGYPLTQGEREGKRNQARMKGAWLTTNLRAPGATTGNSGESSRTAPRCSLQRCLQ